MKSADEMKLHLGEGLPPTCWQQMPEGKEKYGMYLCSREWSELKQAVHERAGGECERCRCHPIDAVHHLTYERKYAEKLEDLQGICNGCHEFTHGKSDHDPLAALHKELEIPKQFVISDENCMWGSVIKCQYCNCENCHISEPTWENGTSTCDNQGRITIPAWCEAGHKFDVVFSGHKGTLRLCVKYAGNTYDD